MTLSISDSERRARLGIRHHLAAPAGTPEAVAGDLLGLHSSDPATVYLSAWCRLRDFDTPTLEHPLYAARTLVRVLGMRRTMFVLPRHLAGIVDAACSRRLAPPQRTRLVGLLSEHVDGEPEAWLDRVMNETLRSVRARGEATAAELKQDVPELALQIGYGQGIFGIVTRILFQLAVEGQIVRAKPKGSWRSSLYSWAATEAWLGEPLPEIDESEARTTLVGAWLRSFGPATLEDIVWWTGLPKGMIVSAVTALDAAPVQLTEGPGLVLPDDLATTDPPPPWIGLLPALDPTTMGWKRRGWYLGPHGTALFDRNGNAGPTIWVDGRVVGGWAQLPDGRVVYRLLEPIGRAAAEAIDAKVEQLQAWLEPDVVTPRFRTPLERELLDRNSGA
ncbi:MAG: winged helix DNA-binding domain-containing protein [Acidimicrobiia bacterium]|nr:winged helix DNA-binding domain-containing protein [Acidimicrobiia bacterium]MDH4306760.1 winged helix DNA-binding domain-containing protein [Acidimicrobiia bacterium]